MKAPSGARLDPPCHRPGHGAAQGHRSLRPIDLRRDEHPSNIALASRVMPRTRARNDEGPRPDARVVSAPTVRRRRISGGKGARDVGSGGAAAVPADVLALALAASLYPPALGAVVALGRGEDLRPRVFAFVAAAYLTTFAVGVIILVLLKDLGVTHVSHPAPGAWFDIALGVLLMVLALVLQRRRPTRPSHTSSETATSKIDRYLESRRLAFVLGIVLYIVPSPIYIALIKSITDANGSDATELLDIAIAVVVMLWLIEVPMLVLLIAPGRAERDLERVNAWFARNGRTVAIVACVGAGAYLIIKGLTNLPG
jgi:hypothetical protein